MYHDAHGPSDMNFAEIGSSELYSLRQNTDISQSKVNDEQQMFTFLQMYFVLLFIWFLKLNKKRVGSPSNR